MKESWMWHELSALDQRLEYLVNNPERHPDSRQDQEKLDSLFEGIDMPFLKSCIEAMLHEKPQRND